jgi:hypothetical protein
MNKTPSPNSNCPENSLQTAHHLMLECSLLSKDRPPILKTLLPPLILQYHINTVSITSFLRRIFQALQEDSQGN